MHSDKQTGRIVGALLLSTMVLGLWSNFGLTGPIFEGGGFLENGATMVFIQLEIELEGRPWSVADQEAFTAEAADTDADTTAGRAFMRS